MMALVESVMFSELLEVGNSVSKSPPEPEAGVSSADGSFAGAIDEEMSTSSLALFSSCSSSGSNLFVSKACFKTACRFAALASASGNVHPSSGRGNLTSAALILWIVTFCCTVLSPPVLKASKDTASTSPEYLCPGCKNTPENKPSTVLGANFASVSLAF